MRRLQETFAPGDRYWHIISDWIYPVPTGVDFRWHPDPQDRTRGVIAVYVPNYGEELRPFLVAHYIREAKGRTDVILGLAQRLGPTTKTTPVEELHTYLREGRRLDAIHQKLDTIITTMEIGRAPGSGKSIRKILRKIRLMGG